MSSLFPLPSLLPLLLLLLLTSLPSTTPLRLTGTIINPTSSFEVLGTFSYTEHGGNFTSHSSSLLPPSSSQALLLYPDTSNLWSLATSPSTPCADKLSAGQGEYLYQGDMDLSPYGQRPHYWLLAVVNCAQGDGAGIGLTYDVHLINPGGVWKREVSYDQQGIAETALAYLVVYLLVLPYLAATLRRSFHTRPSPAFLLLVPTTVLLIVASALTLAAYTHLMDTGYPRPHLVDGAYWAQSLASLALIASVILTVFTPSPSSSPSSPSSSSSRVALAFLLPLLLLTFLAFYITTYILHHRQAAWSTTYQYNNVGGWVLSIVYAVTALAVTVAGWRASGGGKGRWGGVGVSVWGGLYLLAFPAIVLAASLAGPWWVAKAAYAAQGAVLVVVVVGQAVVLRWWRGGGGVGGAGVVGSRWEGMSGKKVGETSSAEPSRMGEATEMAVRGEDAGDAAVEPAVVPV